MNYQQCANQQWSNQFGNRHASGFWDSLLGSAGGTEESFLGIPNRERWIGSLFPDPLPDKDGWVEYLQYPPPYGKLCQFKRNDGEPWVAYTDFSSEFNVAGLKWRLTGIAKETS